MRAHGIVCAWRCVCIGHTYGNCVIMICGSVACTFRAHTHRQNIAHRPYISLGTLCTPPIHRRAVCLYYKLNVDKHTEHERAAQPARMRAWALYTRADNNRSGNIWTETAPFAARPDTRTAAAAVESAPARTRSGPHQCGRQCTRLRLNA